MSNQHVFPLDPATYQPHPIHTRERNWAETNCYVDVWIELLHAWGFDPVAALPFTVGIDFEGDQWTFFKFPLVDLHALYGLEVQEMAVWRPLTVHLVEQVGRGRPLLVELDSYYLPDTAGTAYRREHVKSTVAIIDIDVAQQRLGYFHGQGYYHLQGDDFRHVLRTDGLAHPEILPPYVELVKSHPRQAKTGQALLATSLELLKQHVRRLPETNPFDRFSRAFANDLPWLSESPLEVFHQYSFATLRQFGACYEMTATYLAWLQEHGVEGVSTALQVFTELNAGAKSLQFQLARAMARRKTLDAGLLEEMGTTWQLGADELRSLCDRLPQSSLVMPVRSPSGTA